MMDGHTDDGRTTPPPQGTPATPEPRGTSEEAGRNTPPADNSPPADAGDQATENQTFEKLDDDEKINTETDEEKPLETSGATS